MTESVDAERSRCPNCGAKPLDDRYIAHVEACTGEPPGIGWFWSQGWKGKINVIFVTVSVIVLSLFAKVYNAVREAYSNEC